MMSLQLRIKNQELIEQYFIYGRKINAEGCSCMYLSQRYFGISKVIRAQFNYLIILKLREKKDCKLILSDRSVSFDVDNFMEVYNEATHDEMNFLRIDMTTRNDNKV